MWQEGWCTRCRSGWWSRDRGIGQYPQVSDDVGEAEIEGGEGSTVMRGAEQGGGRSRGSQDG